MHLIWALLFYPTQPVAERPGEGGGRGHKRWRTFALRSDRTYAQKTPHRNSHLANSLHFPNEHQDIVVSLLCLSLSVWSPRICVCVCVCPSHPSQPLLSKGINQTVSPELCVISMDVSPCLRVALRLPDITCLSTNLAPISNLSRGGNGRVHFILLPLIPWTGFCSFIDDRERRVQAVGLNCRKVEEGARPFAALTH